MNNRPFYFIFFIRIVFCWIPILGNSVALAQTPSNKPDVVVYFTADWCVPCQTYGPKLKGLAKKEEVTVLVQDLSVRAAFQTNPLARKYKVQAIPTTVFLYGGTEKIEVGAIPTTRIKRLLGVPKEPRKRSKNGLKQKL